MGYAAYQLWKLDLVKEKSNPDSNYKLTDKPILIHDHSWNAQERSSSAQTKNGKLSRRHMKESHEEAFSFVAILRDCAKKKDLSRGTEVHDDVVKRGLLENCSDALVTMYVKCGELTKARALLAVLKRTHIFSWTALISAYARQGQAQDALDCFDQMQHEGLSPNAMTFASVLKACGILRALERGEHIHHEIARQGLLGTDTVLGNALVHMYVKCGALSKARQVLENLTSHDVVSWSALIVGYAQHGQDLQALLCFEQMREKGLSPDPMTLSCILKVCGSLKTLDKGQEIHDEISKGGSLANDVVLGNALVGMYVKCGVLAKAQQVLEELPLRDTVSWNVLIGGYSQLGQGEQALQFFEQMKQEGIRPNGVTFSYILQACGSIGAADKGEHIHNVIAREGLLESDTVLGTALVDMYAKCGALAKAHQLLNELPSRDVFAWSALIAGYVKHSQGVQAFECYEQMKCEGISPDVVIFSCILKACGILRAVEKGEKIHDEIARRGLLGENIVLDNALVDMYAMCGSLDKAQVVLEELPCRDVVSWTTLIGGFVEQDQGGQALDSFTRMQQEAIAPNAVTYTYVLKACGIVGAMAKGKEIHDEIAQQGFLGNHTVLATALVEMYAKCGAFAKAQEVLEGIPYQDVVPWNAMITGLAQQGQGEKALDCFKRMQRKGIHPDAVTFSGVLNACTHLGLVEEGYKHFVSMSTKYCIKPDLEHYNGLIDLFGRAGHLDKAVGVIRRLQCSNDSAVWHSLLSACQKWGSVSVGRWAFEQVLQQDSCDSAPYVLMASIYAAANMQDAEFFETMGVKNS